MPIFSIDGLMVKIRKTTGLTLLGRTKTMYI
jgi:hypothetical protein